MAETVEIIWVEDELFAARDRYGNSMVLGSTPKTEPQFKGVKPSDLLLLALVTCSAHDVIGILNKQRQGLTNVRVSASSEQEDTAPWRFKEIHIHFEITGTNVNPEFVRRAIDMAETRYCSVYATLKDCVDLTTDFHIVHPD